MSKSRKQHTLLLTDESEIRLIQMSALHSRIRGTMEMLGVDFFEALQVVAVALRDESATMRHVNCRSVIVPDTSGNR